MRKSLYKRIEKNTTAWDLTASCRQFVFNNSNRRKLRRELRRRLRRKSRKNINKFMLREDY